MADSKSNSGGLNNNNRKKLENMAAKTYVLCSGLTPVNYTVDVSDVGTCTKYYEYDAGGSHYETWRTTLRMTCSPAAHVAFNANYDFYIYTVLCDLPDRLNCTDYSVLNTSFANFPMGQTQYDFYADCKYIFNSEFSEQTQVMSGLTMGDQGAPEECTPPAPGCLLGFTGITSTAPSGRDLSDGSIYAGITGQTGSTIEWRINGDVSPGTNFTHTFTGLTSGTYTIRASEADCYDSEVVVVQDGEFRTGNFIVVSPTTNMVAVENPIMLNLMTATNSFTPQYSVNTFNVTGSISNVTINFNLSFPYPYSAEFLSKGYPDRGNYFLESTLKNQVGVSVGSNTTTEIATSLAEALQKDAIISRIYYITSSGTSVTLTSKEYGNSYDLNSLNVTIGGSNLTLTNIVSGIAEYDGQLSANYSLYAELFIDDTREYGETNIPSLYKRIIELELPFNNDNIHQFDFSGTIKNFTSSPKIDFNFTGTTFLGDMITSYTLKYGEKYPLVANSNTKKKRYKGQTGYGYAINSSLPFESQNNMNSYLGVTGVTGQTGVLFLNTAPNTKYSHRDSKEFMSFIISKDYTNPLAVYGNIYNYDGSSSSDIKLFDITISGSTTNFGGVAIVSVGYDDLGLSAYETSSKIRKIDVQIKQNYGGTYLPYSEIKSYLFDIDEQPANFNVAFLNSLGVYETYTFTGELQETSEVSKDSYQKPYPIDFSGAAAVGFEYNSTIDTRYTKTYTVNTGIISADVYYFLQGLLQSNRIYRYDDTHQNYLNVLGQTTIKSSNDNEYSLQIQMKETISENNVNQ